MCILSVSPTVLLTGYAGVAAGVPHAWVRPDVRYPAPGTVPAPYPTKQDLAGPTASLPARSDGGDDMRGAAVGDGVVVLSPWVTGGFH